jgi:hypothetical protein
MFKVNFILIALMLLSLSNALKLRTITKAKACPQYEGFINNCSSWSFTRTYNLKSFTITCKDQNGKDKTTTGYDLNLCLGNSNGQLVYSNGKNGQFAKSCGFCSFDKSVLKCRCRNSKGNGIYSTIDLNNYLGNINGVAQCAKC